ncbi:MAG: hypothetical protein PUE91_06465 [Clostridiales bacterium]|nr:hypothetical protein [Clostridiales bacterium]
MMKTNHKTVHNDPVLNVDTYGNIFMYATHRDLTTSPRHIIRMSEPVQPELLQEALELALIRFPQMSVGLTRGETAYSYHYIDKPPVVLPFKNHMSPYWMGSEDTNGYLFLCGYTRNSIILEYHHCTCDGHGFDEFIRSVLFEYLTLCGKPVENDGTIRTRETEFDPQECEDAFPLLNNVPRSGENHHEDVPSFQIEQPEETLDSAELVTEIAFPFAQMKSFLKRNGGTPLTYVMTALSRAMAQTYFKDGQRERIAAEVPMDLRSLVPSETTHFFVSLLDLPFLPEYFDLSFAEACRKCSEYFSTQRTLEHSAWWAKANGDNVFAMHNADMDIEEKEQLMRNRARNYVHRNSFILTNIGAFHLPESMQKYVLDYAAILPCASMPFGVLVSSYNGYLKISLAQRDHNIDLVRNLLDNLAETGVRATTYSYRFHTTWYDGKHLAE